MAQGERDTGSDQVMKKEDINAILENHLLEHIKNSVDKMSDDNQYRLLLYRSLMAVYRSKQDLGDIQKRAKQNYKLCIRLSLSMYSVGIVLLIVSIIAALTGHADRIVSLTVGGVSLLSITSLCIFDPIKRIHETMGDMAQISLAVNSFQMQADLLMMEIRKTDDGKPDSETIDKIVKGISEAANNSITLIQAYFENKGKGGTSNDSKPDQPPSDKPTDAAGQSPSGKPAEGPGQGKKTNAPTS